MFKMAELLKKSGHDAIIQMIDEFDPYWFAYPPDPELFTTGPLVAGSDDIVVIPETLWPQAPQVYMLPGARRVMFLQNYIWLNQATYLQDPGDTIVCSRFLWNYARRELKANVIGKFTPFLEERVWEAKGKVVNTVLVMGRRNDYHQDLVARLSSMGFVIDYVTEPITQRQLAEKLAVCEYYVHLVHPEGFPMICLEAMRSKAIVVGTTGGGGNEFMHHRETAWCVQDPEFGRYDGKEEFIGRICEALEGIRMDHDTYFRLIENAYEWSLRYNAEAGIDELEEIFRENR